jgi:hypothetical protein
MSLEVIDISDFVFMPNAATACFQYTNNLVSVIGEIDASRITLFDLFFGGKNMPLVDVAFVPNTISVSFNFLGYPNLSDASIDSIINGLADLTDGTAKTLTVHSTVYAKIAANEEWYNAIFNKNWIFE